MEGKKKGKMKRKMGGGGGGGAAIMEDMDRILADPRFAHVSSDLRLRHVPKEERKVKLDSRFHSVLTDDKFYEKSTMDPRGRKGNYSTKEDLLKFYQLSSGEDSDSDEDEGRGSGSDEEEDEGRGSGSGEEVEDEELEKTVERDDGEQENDVKEDNITESDKADESAAVVSIAVRERVEDMSQDYARGEVLFSDDSSDDDSSTDDDEEELGEFEWGELDQDAVWDNEKEVEETSRFAVCNLDWDRVKAADIMILFNSFCPRGGSVRLVTIFTSEYGKQRLAEEDIVGPQELRVMSKCDGDINSVDLEKLEKGQLDTSAGATKNDYEALRRYQRNRLRYYYAVVECDTTETARVIYQECDRQPYEGAGVHLDLRYIPSEMTFDETPHDVCHRVPESYEVKTFVTTALHNSRPILTWDETDPERQKVLSSAMTRAMKGDQLDDEYLKGLIASSSDEEGEDILVDDEGNDCDSDEDDATKASRIAKFRALISEIDEKERKKKERDIDLEETFNFGDNKEEEEESEEEKEDGEEEESGQEKDKSTAKLNPFDQYLEKRRAKRKERNVRRKKNKAKENAGSDESDASGAMSDDELPEDAKDLYSDPFFAEELKKMNGDKKKRKKKTDAKLSESSGTELETQGNLELLFMKEDNEDRKHFSMREIIENSKEKKKKRRKTKLKKKKEETLQQKQQESATDDFKVNTSDPRFVGLLASGDFNIDPSHSQFKRTRAMDTLIAEVQKKRVAESFEGVPDIKRNRPEDRSSLELSVLVKKMKSKAKKPSIRQ